MSGAPFREVLPRRKDAVTIKVESACCGAGATWRKTYSYPPWECASCGRPCDIRAIQAGRSDTDDT